MIGAPFQPQGQTVLVGTTAVQVLGQATSSSPIGYRIRCLVTGYLTWGNQSVAAAGAPSAGSPVSNTIGMTAGGIESFTLPAQLWFISNVAGGFEMTPGEGL